MGPAPVAGRRARRQGIPWRRWTLAFLITLIPACEHRQILLAAHLTTTV